MSEWSRRVTMVWFNRQFQVPSMQLDVHLVNDGSVQSRMDDKAQNALGRE